jgi:hypothetical protein
MEATLESAPVESSAIDAMSELSSMDDGKPVVKGEQSQSSEQARPEPVKPVAAKPAPTKSVVVEKSVVRESPAKPTVEANVSVPQEKNFKELRATVDRERTEKVQLQNRLKELETKLATSSVPKEFEEKLTARETELKQMREKLAQHDFTTSEEYQTNFYKPYVASWTRAMQSVMGLSAVDGNGNTVAVSKADAEALLTMPEGKMLAEARTLFGDDNLSALTLLATHKQRIQESYERMSEAKTNGQKLSDANREKAGLAKAEQANRIKGLWKTENEELAKSNPLFQPDETDAEGTDLLKKGLQEVDHAFSDDPNLTAENRLKLHAKIRNQSAAFSRLDSTVKARDARIVELETELKAFRASEPDTAASANGTSTKAKSNLDELEEMDRQNR